MIGIVMRPVEAPVVKHERLYQATVGKIGLCLVRARNAPHAERKLMECFKNELVGTTISYDLEKYLEQRKQEKEDEDRN